MKMATKKTAVCRWRWSLPSAGLALIVLNLCLVALACAQDDRRPQPDDTTSDATVVQIEGPGNVNPDDIRFEALDVFVDSGNQPLAAYQFELISRTPGVEIVGIEGGEHAAFSEPPYYDPQAMRQNRVIIAAFHTGRDLPAGTSRVARIHVQLQGPGVKEYETKLSVSATADGTRIPAEVSISKARA